MWRARRAQLLDYTVTRDELIWRSSDVFKWIADGRLKVGARPSSARCLAPSLKNAVFRRTRCLWTRRSLSMRRRTATCTSRRARAPARSSTPHRKRRQGPIAAPPYRAGCANDRIRRNKSALLVLIRPPMDVRPTGRAGLEGCSTQFKRRGSDIFRAPRPRAPGGTVVWDSAGVRACSPSRPYRAALTSAVFAFWQ